MTVTRQDLELRLEEIRSRVKDPKHGVFGPDSMVWKITREHILFAGGARALLLQISHPWVARAGIDHSQVKQDPMGRFIRTMDFVGKMTFGDIEEAFKVARAVHNIHSKVRGTMPNGEKYEANNEDALFWVHATLWETAMTVYERYVGRVRLIDKERYYEETKFFAYLFGVSEERIPKTWEDFNMYYEHMLESGLKVTPEAENLAQFIFQPLPQLKLLGDGYKSLTKVLLQDNVARAFKMPPGLIDEGVEAAFRHTYRATRRKLPPMVRYSHHYLNAAERIGYKPH